MGCMPLSLYRKGQSSVGYFRQVRLGTDFAKIQCRFMTVHKVEEEAADCYDQMLKEAVSVDTDVRRMSTGTYPVTVAKMMIEATNDGDRRTLGIR